MTEYIYGKNSVTQKLKNPQSIVRLYVAKNKHRDLVSLAISKKVPYEEIEISRLNQMVKGTHQGVVAQVKGYESVELKDLLNQLDMTQNPILVMCDQLEDPHNLGAILRTCDGAGVKGVIIGKHRSVTLNATVAKVSTGAIETIPVTVATNLSKTLTKLKEFGFWVIGADNTEAQDYREMPKDRPIVLVVGSEGKGISKEVKKQCDYRVVIPMKGVVNSLNVSVATGILLYELIS